MLNPILSPPENLKSRSGLAMETNSSKSSGQCSLGTQINIIIEEPLRYLRNALYRRPGIKIMRRGSCLPRRVRDNLLVSYPRSGRNFLLFLTEFVTRSPSNRFYSFEQTFYSGRWPVFEITHSPNFEWGWRHREEGETKKLIFLLRNYKECLIRHRGNYLAECNYKGKKFFEASSMSQPPHWYVSNIEYFEQFQGDKILIYYEDLIASPAIEIERMIRFLGWAQTGLETRLEYLASNLHEMRERSIAYYDSHQVSRTRGDPTLTVFHSNDLSEEVVRELDAAIFERIPDLADKFLLRYRNETG